MKLSKKIIEWKKVITGLKELITIEFVPRSRKTEPLTDDELLYIRLAWITNIPKKKIQIFQEDSYAIFVIQIEQEDGSFVYYERFYSIHEINISKAINEITYEFLSNNPG